MGCVGCSHWGGGNSNSNDVIMEWVVDPFGDGNSNDKEEIYDIMPLPPPPMWTLTTENKLAIAIAVAVAVTQCERAFRYKSSGNLLTLMYFVWYSSDMSMSRMLKRYPSRKGGTPPKDKFIRFV